MEVLQLLPTKNFWNEIFRSHQALDSSRGTVEPPLAADPFADFQGAVNFVLHELDMPLDNPKGRPVTVEPGDGLIRRIGTVVVVDAVRSHPQQYRVLPKLAGFVILIGWRIGEITRCAVHDVIAQFVVAQFEGWCISIHDRTTPGGVAFHVLPEHTLLDVGLQVVGTVRRGGQPSSPTRVGSRLPVWKRPKILIVPSVELAREEELLLVVGAGGSVSGRLGSR